MMPVTDEANAEVFDRIEPVYFQEESFDATGYELSVKCLNACVKCLSPSEDARRRIGDRSSGNGKVQT